MSDPTPNPGTNDQNTNPQNQTTSTPPDQTSGQPLLPDAQQLPPITDPNLGQGATSSQQQVSQPIDQGQAALIEAQVPVQPGIPSVVEPSPDAGSGNGHHSDGGDEQHGDSSDEQHGDGGGEQHGDSGSEHHGDSGGEQHGDSGGERRSGTSFNDNTLLSDPTFKVLHNAFLTGWNLLELRSRILLAALDVKFMLTYNQVSAFNLVDTLLEKTPRLHRDKEGLTRLVLPTAQAGILGGDLFAKLPIEPSDAVWNTSVWRAMFYRIAVLQKATVDTNDTTNTIYDLPSMDDANFPYTYLFPDGTNNFTSIGISDSDVAQTALSASFRLYDITRRALNCLIQLYIQPDEVLNSGVIQGNRDRMIPVILKAAPSIPLKGNAIAPDDVIAAIKRFTGLTVRFLEAWDGYLREYFYIGRSLDNEELEIMAYEAGRSLSTLSWGIALITVPLENTLDNPSLQDEEKIELMEQLYQAWQSVFNPRDIIHIQHQLSGLSDAADAAYCRVKPPPRPSDSSTTGENSPDQSSNQSTTPNELDAYRPSNALHAIKRSLDYWQAAVLWIASPQAQSSICKSHGINENDCKAPLLSLELSRQLRVALIEQADIWQSLITGRQNLQSITTETVTQKILSQFMSDCENAFMSDVTSDVENMAKQAQEEVKSFANHYRFFFIALGSIVAILLILFVGAEIFALLPNSPLGNTPFGNAIVTLVSILGVGYVTHRVIQQPTSASGTNQSSTQATPASNSVATNPSAQSSNGSNLFAQISGFFAASGGDIMKIFTACSQQVQREYTILDRNASVSYPLIECFILNSAPPPGKKDMTPSNGKLKDATVGKKGSVSTKQSAYDFAVHDSYSFLTNVIWTHEEREAEIQQIVQAAFGPLGLFVGAKLKSSKGDSAATPTTPAG